MLEQRIFGSPVALICEAKLWHTVVLVDELVELEHEWRVENR